MTQHPKLFFLQTEATQRYFVMIVVTGKHCYGLVFVAHDIFFYTVCNFKWNLY